MNLDLILEEFDNQSRDDLSTIRAVLPHCSRTICISFALHCALDIEYLMTDKRSTNALRAVELFLKTGTPIPQETLDAANAAYAAYATAANAAYAAAMAAYATAANATAYAANAAAMAAYATAANATANAAYAAAMAAYATAANAANKDPNIYNDKMREYLNKLKELVLMEIPAGSMSEDAAWLLAVVI